MSNVQASSADTNALKALGLAIVGIILGIFAFKLHLRGGDEKFFTYSLGLACSGFFMSSLVKLFKALGSKSSAQAGAPGAARVLSTAFIVTLVGVLIFIFSSILANYMATFENPSGLEIFLGLIAALLSAIGPVIIGGVYFYRVQQSLCEAGWNIGAALMVALLSAGLSICAWYILNIKYGPQLYHLFLSK